MADKKYSLFDKAMMLVFSFLMLASCVFFGHRAMTKPAYEARELKQTQLLAVSVIEIMAEKSVVEPVLIIDHRAIKDNWRIKAVARKENDFTEITSDVSSGWNSRSPKSTVYKAKVFDDGGIEYENATAARLAEAVRGVKPSPKDETVTFRLPEENKPCPVDVVMHIAEYTDYKGDKYIVLRP